MATEHVRRVGLRRPRILWIVMGALLLVTLVPISLYHQRVLKLSEDKLFEAERVQQSQVTRALAGEMALYVTNLSQQLAGEREILRLAGLIENLDNPKRTLQVTGLLEDFLRNNRDILFVSATGKNGKGQKAVRSGETQFPADADLFVRKELERAFSSSIQGGEYRSNPLAYGPENRPAILMAQPLSVNQQFSGMLAVLVSLERVGKRLGELSKRGGEVYLVDPSGRIVVHPDTRRYVPGTDVSPTIEIVAEFKKQPDSPTVTSRFTLQGEQRTIGMLGTYSPIPELHWAVVAQRDLESIRSDVGVETLNWEAFKVVLGFSVFALLIGYFFAVGITKPIRRLAESTRAISRGEFHERALVGGAAEISELAGTFNKMADDIGQYVEQLKQAAEENRELFIGSIRMLAAAIDEKDPYTRGHSGRVAKYSVIIAEHLKLGAEELDRLRISALLHDVGKIGVDDRVLKKPGALTPEEFELMKQHPAKGANIMRPVAQLKEMLPGIELHHEHIDGRGYPYGLHGDQIPLMARIISVADTLDAMTTNRPYQSAMELGYALEKIRSLAGSKFDPNVVEALETAVRTGKLRLSATLVEV